MAKSKQNLYGQFNTDDELSKSVLNKIDSFKKISGDVLEPSFGKGSFLLNLDKYNCDSITGIEIDDELFNQFDNKEKKFNLRNEDFILSKMPDSSFDFIVGNPPYIELCYSFYNKEFQNILKEKYGDMSNGRLNLVHLFFKESFRLIKNDGIIAFLLPSSILTSPVYKKIRKIIYEDFNVEYVNENVNFKDVAIKVCLLILRKVKKENKNKKYFYLYYEHYYITENYKKFSDKKTLKDSGFNIKIGSVVWNQVKEILSEDSSDLTLLYSSNISKGELIFNDIKNKEKKQYIKNQSVSIKDCVIMPRTISSSLKYCLIENNDKYIFENHVLTITHENKEILLKFYDKLKKGLYDDLLMSFFNSSNLTVQELLSLPI